MNSVSREYINGLSTEDYDKLTPAQKNSVETHIMLYLCGPSVDKNYSAAHVLKESMMNNGSVTVMGNYQYRSPREIFEKITHKYDIVGYPIIVDRLIQPYCFCYYGTCCGEDELGCSGSQSCMVCFGEMLCLECNGWGSK